MNFQDFIKKGWNDHASDAAGVADRLSQGIELMQTPAELPALAGLSLHVLGEHLGRWDDGIAFFTALLTHPLTEKKSDNLETVHRCLAILHLAAGHDGWDQHLAKAHNTKWPEASTKVRVYAGAAVALAGQGETERSSDLLAETLRFADYGPQKGDPAARSLAITGNNLAADLEEKASRTDAETALMIKAAEIGRQYWEVSGSWVEVERAEYRLAMSHLQAGNAAQSLQHADRCLAICQRQQASLFEQFFAHEARTKALRALGRSEDADKALADTKSALSNTEWAVGYMKDVLKKLEV